MKTLLVSVSAIAAIVMGMTSCERPLTRADAYVLEIPRGHRVKLKLNGKNEADAVAAFEKLLESFDPNGKAGTKVNLRFNDGSTVKEEYGPENNGFSPNNGAAVGPDGSMHNTQRIVAPTEKDIKDVLNSLDASFNP